jgi:hypothetical protein
MEIAHDAIQTQQCRIPDALVDRDAEIGCARARNGRVCFHVLSSAIEVNHDKRKNPPPRFAGVWALVVGAFCF